MSGVDLTTRYMGLELRSPIAASSSPLTEQIDRLQALEEAGAGAVVLPSLFEEQIEHEELELVQLGEIGNEFSEAAFGLFPEVDVASRGDEHLERIRRAKEKLSIPVIASLNGTTPGGWERYGKAMEQAGADALELNIYHIAVDPRESGARVEQRYVELVHTLRARVEIPLAIKIGPFFSAIPHMAGRFAEAGADGLVLFNRFYQPDIDLESLEVRPDIELSTSSELRLPLRWIAILSGRVDLSLAATTGVHTAEDVIKLILAGADLTMMASALLRHGPGHLRRVLETVESWLAERGYESIEQAKGSLSQRHSSDPEGFERANYMEALTSYTPRG